MSRRRSALATALAVALVALSPRLVDAHDLERTRVVVTFSTDGRFVLDVVNEPGWLLQRLAPFAGLPAGITVPAETRDHHLRELTAVFADRVVFFVDGHEVRASQAEYVPPLGNEPADGSAALAAYRLTGSVGPDARVLRWYYGLVIDPYPVTVHRADGRSIVEWVGGDEWSRAIHLTGQFVAPSRWRIAWRYLALGYTHILPNGLDHVLFVLGLFLLSFKVRPILLQVTTFTVAHSITLGLTLYGFVSLSPRIVEPLIALSIAYVAIENLVTNELKPWRLGLVFSFGLLHGMGFAGVLRELGLPRGEFLTALLTFNLGVEAGQLSVIGLAALAVVWSRHRVWYHTRVVVPASLAIAAVGLYWTLTRVLA